MKYLFFLVISLLTTPFVGQATTVRSFAFDGLCETAQTIVYVRCLDKESLTLPDRDGIFTQYRFDVVEVVKGEAGSELVLVLPGGKHNGQRMEIAGMPQFAPGQETVLFLSEPDANGSPWPVGLGQGCYGVTVGEDGGRQVVFGRQNPVDPALRSKPALQESARQNKVALQTFMKSVRDVLKIEHSKDRQAQ